MGSAAQAFELLADHGSLQLPAGRCGTRGRTRRRQWAPRRGQPARRASASGQKWATRSGERLHHAGNIRAPELGVVVVLGEGDLHGLPGNGMADKDDAAVMPGNAVAAVGHRSHV